MKRAVILSLSVAFCFATIGISFAAEKEAAKPAAVPSVAGPARATAGRMMPRSNLSILYGAIIKIDKADPANVKLEVKNEADNTTHIVELTPDTKVTKATDVSELKAGDNVRVMARKTDNKEVAMGVMFGKIKKPAPRPVRPAAMSLAPAAAPSAQQKPKK